MTNTMPHLNFYPHLPVLNVVYAVTLLQRVGLGTNAIARFTGYSKTIVIKWVRGNDAATLPAAESVSELTYRVLAAIVTKKWPTKPPGKGRPAAKEFVTVLTSDDPEMSLHKLNIDTLPIKPKLYRETNDASQ